jgi:hypothetical protein
VRTGAGRKPLPERLRQSFKTMSTFTEAERAELEAAADGRPIGTFIREVVLAFLRRRRNR